MRSRFQTLVAHYFERLRESFWLLPAGSVLLAIGTAIALIAIDRAELISVTEIAPWLGEVSPEGTQTFLGTVATSVLSLAGVTFSVTIVALTLASSQFGPRLLRNFIRSRGNQLALGVLLATHAYCLVVLRSVRVGELSFVPHLATSMAFLLTLISLAMFIYFIHHVVTSIQAEQVVANVHQELCRAIDRFFGPEEARAGDEEERKEGERDSWQGCQQDEHSVTAGRSGYVQAIDVVRLVEVMEGMDRHGRVLVQPGGFLVAQRELLAIDKGESLGEETVAKVRSCFLIGSKATAEQDIEYSIRQLVEVALRALSPGVNDPFTAINCIDYLGEALTRVVRKRLPRHDYFSEEGVLRVTLPPMSFAALLGAACHQIRQAAVDRPDVSIRLLERLYDVGKEAREKTQVEAVAKQAEMVARVAKSRTVTEEDTQAIEERYQRIEALMEEQ